MTKELRPTKITKIPHDWSVVRFEEIISLFHTGIWGENPTPNLISYSVIRSTEITHDGKIDVSTVAERNVPEKKVTKYKLEDGDIVLVASSGSSHLIGRAALFKQPDDGRTYLFSNFMVRIRPHNVDSDFLFYWLNSSHYYRFLQSFQQTSTGLRNLPKKEFKELKVSLPLLPEQRKIAEILGTVDEAIEKVGQAIEKTERLKKGLMLELLTKGIGHEEFKDTEIGRIPKEWEVVQLEQVIKDIRNGFASGKRDENGIVQIRMNNVTTAGKVIFDSYLKVPKPDNINEWLLDSGDFLFNNTNSYDLVGKSAVFKESPFPCTYSNHFTRIKFNTSRANPNFILYHFLVLWRKGYFKSVAIRHVGQSAVHNRYLLKLSIPLPSIVEQRTVEGIISGADQYLKTLIMKKLKFKKIKKGLMNDLLIGKRRVKI